MMKKSNSLQPLNRDNPSQNPSIIILVGDEAASTKDSSKACNQTLAQNKRTFTDDYSVSNGTPKTQVTQVAGYQTLTSYASE